MMTLTLEDYCSKYWPKLQGAIDQLLNMKPGAYIPISYEQMYRSVASDAEHFSKFVTINTIT